MTARFFETPTELRAWLEEHHEDARELWVGFYKVRSGRPSVTWPQAVDEALCFGWIDGVRKRLDDTSYMIRFTPRKPRSAWSAVNIERVAELSTLGLMRPAGLRAFDARRDREVRDLRVRASEPGARRRPGAPFPSERASVGLLPGPAGVVPADRGLVGDQREENGNPREAACPADRGLGGRQDDTGAHTPDVGPPARFPFRASCAEASRLAFQSRSASGPRTPRLRTDTESG